MYIHKDMYKCLYISTFPFSFSHGGRREINWLSRATRHLNCTNQPRVFPPGAPYTFVT